MRIHKVAQVSRPRIELVGLISVARVRPRTSKGITDLLLHARYTDETNKLNPWSRDLGNLVNSHRDGDRALQLSLLNEEYLVSASHQLALTTSLPFVHTARRYYRLNGSVTPSDQRIGMGNQSNCFEKSPQLGHLEEVKVVTRFP